MEHPSFTDVDILLPGLWAMLGYVEKSRLLPVDHNREIILDYLGDPM